MVAVPSWVTSGGIPVSQNQIIKMSGPLSDDNAAIRCATVKEGMSEIFETTIEFYSKDKSINLGDIVGQNMTVSVQDAHEEWRDFHGVCVEARFLGFDGGFWRYVADVRPWLWLLKQRQNKRIFQQKSIPDIISEVFEDAGFSADHDKNLSGTYPVKDYVAQYNETDYDFVCRLMEEVGIYYFFDHTGEKEKLIMADGGQAHSPLPGYEDIDYHFAKKGDDRRTDHIFEWASSENIQPGKVSLIDYDFEAPTSDLAVSSSILSGSHNYTENEIYMHPGAYRATSEGDDLAKFKMESFAAKHKTWLGRSNARQIAVGGHFNLQNHERDTENAAYLVTHADHVLRGSTNVNNPNSQLADIEGGIELAGTDADGYVCSFTVIEKDTQFRAPLKTPAPIITGLQTALVVGPPGEEIYTDEYGRIKIQFPWDRVGEKNEKSSLWVRVVTPWSGEGWGMIHIPRIGQEVVIAFEDGDPDRPICTGCMFNKDNMPPYALPANKTQSGVKTNTSKDGKNFNELMMEDKKDSELVRFQAARDYTQIVKNNATITIGEETKEDGDLTQTIHRNKTETLKTGDHLFKVEAGKQTLEIKKDKKETIEGKSALTVTGDVSETLKQGNFSLNTKMGNCDVKADKGKVTIEAMQSIELKVGKSSVKIDMSGVTVKGPMINVKGDGMVNVKGSMTSVKGDAMLMLKGGVTMIN